MPTEKPINSNTIEVVQPTPESVWVNGAILLPGKPARENKCVDNGNC